MNQSGEPSHAADVVRRLERPEKVVQPHSLSTATALPQADPQNRPLDVHEGPALRRSRSRASNISPWLFVMATALNTMVASVLAVIITLGVVRQERSDILPREAALASAYARPGLGVQSETMTPNVPFQQISLGGCDRC
jgi:hypothetical protein